MATLREFGGVQQSRWRAAPKTGCLSDSANGQRSTELSAVPPSLIHHSGYIRTRKAHPLLWPHWAHRNVGKFARAPIVAG
jgi:hypothetical protein